MMSMFSGPSRSEIDAAKQQIEMHRQLGMPAPTMTPAHQAAMQELLASDPRQQAAIAQTKAGQPGDPLAAETARRNYKDPAAGSMFKR